MQFGILELGGIAGALVTIVGLGALILRGVTRIINRAVKPIKEVSEKIDLHNNALRAVLKNSITRAHREFAASGKIGRYALQSAMEMYEQYKALGGNSFVDDIILDLRKVPIDMGESNNQ